MASSITILQAEIQLDIADYLDEDRKALINWSCASKYFRDLLISRLAKSITLHNTEKSGTLINEMISKYGQHTKEFHFKGLAPADTEDESTSFDTLSIFPDSVQNILSNLNRFPNLQTVSIEFPIDFMEAGFYESMYYFDDTESEEQVAEAETTEAWRALMAKTYTALSQNMKPIFKNLIFKNLLPKEVSIFNSPEFHRLLGKMERFELSVYGEDNGCGWKISRLEGFIDFVANFDHWFFDHLTNVADLTINASEDGRLGSLYLDLNLNSMQMPLLRSLHFKNIYLCPGLQRALVGHADTLEVIVMDNCYAYDEDCRIFWDYIFTSLIEANPKNLRYLSIFPTKLPLNDNDFPGDTMYMRNPDSDEVAEVRRILREDSKRRLFAYATISQKYDQLYDDEKENLARFLKGDDQRAYDDLVLIIDENARRYEGM